MRLKHIQDNPIAMSTLRKSATISIACLFLAVSISDTLFATIPMKREALPPPLDVAFETEDVCLGNPTYFTDTTIASVGATITDRHWDFGDGASSDNSTPTTFHTYDMSGDYQVTLTLTDDQGASGSLTQWVTVHPNPIAAFAPASACIYDPVITFENTSTISDGSTLEYLWEFENGASSSDVHPTQSFDDPGYYEVMLTAISDQGCIDQVTQNAAITQVSANIIVQEPDYVCSPVCFNLISFATSSYGDLDSFEWTTSTGSMGDSVVYSPCLTTSDPNGEWVDIRLVVSTDAGCRDTAWIESPHFCCSHARPWLRCVGNT